MCMHKDKLKIVFSVVYTKSRKFSMYYTDTESNGMGSEADKE